LYSIRPTDGSGDFTFSRGSNLAATRVDVNGLIEKGRENLLTYSNDFSDTDWAKTGISLVSGGQVGYDGSNDAYLITSNASTTNHYLRQSASTQSGVQTYSVYAKGNGYDVQLRATGVGGTTNWVSFNLVSGSVGTSGAGIIESKMTSLGNGWYRCSAAFNDSGSPFIGIYMVEDADTAGSGPSYTGDGVSGVFLQDAQVEKGLVATDYIETGASTAQAGILEDMPRLDYSGGASCPSLLLEPQRTNKLIYSEYFGAGTGWGDNGAVTRDFGYLAPDGTYSATKFTNIGSGGSSGYVFYSGVLPDDSRSVYARTTSGTGTANLMTYFGNTNNVFTITEEWQRFDLSSVTTATGQSSFYLVDFRDGDLNEIILWGAQCEEASYPTSYIPTYGSSVTRSNDAYTNSSIGASLSNGYTAFVECETLSTSEYNQIQFKGSGANYLLRIGNQVRVLSSSYVANNTSGVNKFALQVESTGNFNLFKNGSSIATGSGVTFDLIEIKNDVSGSNVKQWLVFPTALTDSECIALTTL